MYTLTVLSKQLKDKIQFEISRDGEEDEDEDVADPQYLQIAAYNGDLVKRFSVVNYEKLISGMFILGRTSVKRSKGGASMRILATFDLRENPQREIVLNRDFSVVLLHGSLTPFSALDALAVFHLNEKFLSHDGPIIEIRDQLFEHPTEALELQDDSIIVLPKKKRANKHFIQNTRQSLVIDSQQPLSYGYLFEEADVLLPRKVYS